MLEQSTENATSMQERRSAHVIHYDLSYIVQGTENGTDGAIVLLHDILGGVFTWRDLLPQLAGTNRAVYAIDMLGYGLSDQPWPADTSIWGQADCLNFLFNQLNLINIVLVGHGIGGGVAQVLATRLSRDHVAALVLIDTICYEYTFAPDWPLPEMSKRQDPDMPKRTQVEDLIHDLQETVPNGVQNTDRFKDVMNEWIEPWDSELGKELLFQQIRLLYPNYCNSVATDLQVMGKPALIIWGEKDEQIPLKYAQRLHREIPESRLVIIPGAGHMILFDAPNQVASALTDFVGRL
jgi:pimeloyl-ACP methyl ester carboxylesterase